VQAWMNTTMSINNIVVSATATEGIDIDFLELFLKCKRNSSFGSLNVKLSPSTLCQLFSNGKLIVIGGKTEEEARQVFDMYMAQFADLGHPIEYKDYHIQNIVACYKHTERINLDRLARKYSLEYFPELFPAVRYRDDYRKVTVNIFHTGSCVILGAKTVSIVHETVSILKDLIKCSK